MFDSDCFDIRVMGGYIGSNFLRQPNFLLVCLITLHLKLGPHNPQQYQYPHYLMERVWTAHHRHAA
jgi:hypothetical protein